MKVGFQGIRGAYSELALYKYFGRDADSVGFDSFEDMFDSLALEGVDYAFVPVENTIAGTVVENYDLLLSEDCTIIGEFFMKIDHMLLGKKDSDLNDIKEAWSHPHALKQCKDFLKSKGINAVPRYDTAGAAMMVAKQPNSETGAIASELCADIYGLKILTKGIQTNHTNTTRFVIVVKTKNRPADVICQKTTLVFKTRHYPGALVDCLKIFQEHNLNLTKLESRPVPENPWEYVFYTDFEGGIDTKPVEKALKALKNTALFIKILGSYPKGDL